MAQTDPELKRDDARPVDEPVPTDAAPPAETVVVDGGPAGQPETVTVVEETPPARQESRFGRFMRAALRTLLLLAVVFGLGALTVYYFLYRPMVDQLNTARTERDQAVQQLDVAEQNLQQAQSDLELANGRAESADEQLEVEVARVAVLRAMNDLTNARMALAADDPDGAVTALEASEARLQEIAPTLQERDPAQLETLQALYSLAKNDIARDPELAALDLDRLQTELDIAEKNVLQ